MNALKRVRDMIKTFSIQNNPRKMKFYLFIYLFKTVSLTDIGKEMKHPIHLIYLQKF